jgi:hypothetical protein
MRRRLMVSQFGEMISVLIVFEKGMKGMTGLRRRVGICTRDEI